MTEHQRRGPGRWADGLALLIVAWVGWCALSGTFIYNLFTDRDLLRAALLPVTWDATGSEMTGDFGARLPGAGLSAMLWAGEASTGGPEGAFRLQILLWLGGALALYAMVAPVLGRRPALVALALLLVHPAVVETEIALWNPGFVAGFGALAAGALVRVSAGADGRFVPMWAGALATGAQVHMTAGVWALVTLPGVLAARWPDRRRWWGVTACVVVALFLPYVVSEVVNGAPNTLRLIHQAQGTDHPGDAAPAAPGLRFGLFLLGAPAGELDRLLQADRGRVAYAAVLGALVLIGMGAGLWRRDGQAAHALAWGLLLECAGYALGGSTLVEARYVVVLAPALALLAAVGLERLLARVPTGLRALEPVTLLLLAGLGVERLSAVQTAWSLDGAPYSWRALSTSLSTIEAQTGWTLREISGRAAWRREDRSGERMPWRAWPAVGFLLHQRGESFPGSQAPPCALVAGGSGVPSEITPEVVSRLIDARSPVTVLSEPVALGADWRFVLYAPGSGRCPTSMVQRYVDTEAEAAARPLWKALPFFEATPLPFVEGQRVAMMVGAHPASDALVYAMMVVVDLSPRAGHVDARFESNQLRGYADNVGYTDPWMLEQARLIFTSQDGAEVALPLAEDRIGRAYDLPPIAVGIDLAAGAWRVELAGVVVDADGRALATTRDAAPFRALLVERVEVP